MKLCGACLAEWGPLDICCPQCRSAGEPITISQALRLLNGATKALHVRSLALEKANEQSKRVLAEVAAVMAKVKKLLGSDGLVKLD